MTLGWLFLGTMLRLTSPDFEAPKDAAWHLIFSARGQPVDDQPANDRELDQLEAQHPPPTLLPMPSLTTNDRKPLGAGHGVLKGREMVGVSNGGDPVASGWFTMILRDSPYARWVTRSLAAQWRDHEPAQPWVALSPTFKAYAVTRDDADGYWTFRDLPAGKYDVLEFGGHYETNQFGNAFDYIDLMSTDDPIDISSGSPKRLARDDVSLEQVACFNYSPFLENRLCLGSAPLSWLNVYR